jgi:hypothetical protein
VSVHDKDVCWLRVDPMLRWRTTRCSMLASEIQPRK